MGNNLNAVVWNPTDSLSLNGGVSGLTGTLQVLGSGTFSIYQPANSSTTIGSVVGQPGSTVVLGGDPTSSTTLTANFPLNIPGQTVKFQGGYWVLTNGGSYESNLEVDSGLVIRPYTGGDFYDLEGVKITGGTLLSQNQYGMRMGGNQSNQSGGLPFTGIQTGGLLSVSNTSNGGQNVQLGSSTPNVNASYTLTGGTFSITNSVYSTNFTIGAATSGTGSTTFALGGTGELIVSAGISGSQGGSAKQVFNFYGGTLLVSSINATNLCGLSNGTATAQGTLYNTGGTLSPGGIFGTPGKTAITGNYVQSGGALAIDIGGTTAGSGFQTGQYDTVSVSGAATVGGALNVSLTNSYVPAAGQSFNVLTAGSPITGSFSNLANGSWWITPGNVAMLGVYYGSGATAAGFNSSYVTVATLVGSNNGGIWNSPTGGSWTIGSNWGNNVGPGTGGAGVVAYMGNALQNSDTVTLPNGNTTLGILDFLSTASYTISGGNILQFNNGSNGQINDYGGSHTISTLINVLGNNNLNVAVSNAGDTLTLSGGVEMTNGTGTIQYSGAGNLTMTNGVWPIGGIQDNAAGNLVVSGSLGASGAVNNSGSGSVSISDGATMASLTNSSTGYVTISGGLTATGAVLNSSPGSMAITGDATVGSTLTNSGGQSLDHRQPRRQRHGPEFWFGQSDDWRRSQYEQPHKFQYWLRVDHRRSHHGCRYGLEFGIGRQYDLQRRPRGSHADGKQHLGVGECLSGGRPLPNHRDHQQRGRSDHRAGRRSNIDDRHQQPRRLQYARCQHQVPGWRLELERRRGLLGQSGSGQRLGDAAL